MQGGRILSGHLPSQASSLCRAASRFSSERLKPQESKFSSSISESRHHARRSEALPSWLDGRREQRGARHTMFGGPSCTAGFKFRQDKRFFFIHFFCFFVLVLGSLFHSLSFFPASLDLLSGCWVDRHLRFFGARVLMFHL